MHLLYKVFVIVIIVTVDIRTEDCELGERSEYDTPFGEVEWKVVSSELRHLISKKGSCSNCIHQSEVVELVICDIRYPRSHHISTIVFDVKPPTDCCIESVLYHIPAYFTNWC